MHLRKNINIPANDEDRSRSIASMRTTPQVSGLGPVTVYIARFKCRAGLDPDRAYLFLLGWAHQKEAPGRARSTRLHCHLFCRAVLDPGRALSICGSVNVAYVLHQAPNLSWPKATPLLTQLSQKTITQNTSREARTFLFTAIWRRTYGRGPFRQREGKPAAVTTRTTRSDFPISSMGYFLYTLSHRHYSSYLGLWYNSSMGPS